MCHLNPKSLHTETCVGLELLIWVPWTGAAQPQPAEGLGFNSLVGKHHCKPSQLVPNHLLLSACKTAKPSWAFYHRHSRFSPPVQLFGSELLKTLKVLRLEKSTPACRLEKILQVFIQSCLGLFPRWSWENLLWMPMWANFSKSWPALFMWHFIWPQWSTTDLKQPLSSVVLELHVS